jgi:hypothetical protein
VFFTGDKSKRTEIVLALMPPVSRLGAVRRIAGRVPKPR